MARWLSRVLGLALLCPLTACLQLSLGGDDDDDNAGSSAQSTANQSTSQGLSGRGCGTDPESGVQLCLGLSLCPDQVFDREAWPSCGYRVHNTSYDLQCVCGDMLCPIGTPLTCDQIPQLLAAQSRESVCAAQSEGRCVLARGGVIEGLQLPGCDRQCAKQCGSDQGCLRACGCAE